jgi:hypothetical protein
LRSAGGVLKRLRRGEGGREGGGETGRERESNENIHHARERAQKHTHYTHIHIHTHTHTCLGPTKPYPPVTHGTRGREFSRVSILVNLIYKVT